MSHRPAADLPTGHCFNGAIQDVIAPPPHSGRLMTAVRKSFPSALPGSNSGSVSSSRHSNPLLPQAALEPRYQKILDDIPSGNDEYYAEMLNLCTVFQKQGDVPTRPTSDDVKDFFRAVPFPRTSTGKGSKGGMRHHECLWPGCDFKDTLQKCMDHLFSLHMKVKFHKCGVDGCEMVFARKFDCDKHKSRTHNVPRPRAAGRNTQAPARSTRAAGRKGNPY